MGERVPFRTLSVRTLARHPLPKMSDQGLVDGSNFLTEFLKRLGGLSSNNLGVNDEEIPF